MKTLIIHLSDIHLRETDNASEDKFQFIGKALQNEELNLDRAVVIVSGDIAFSGNTTEYNIATKYFSTLADDLKQRLKLSDIQFNFAPGNHDCNFHNQKSTRKIVINSIRSGEVPDKHMVDCCCEVQSEFFTFRDSFPSATPQVSHSPIHWQYSIGDEDYSLQIRCYNTAWMSRLNEEQGSLHIPDSVLNSNDWSEESDYVISVFHHPYNWMPSASYRRFRSAIEESSDLILTGHEHEPDHYQKYSFSGEINEYLEGAVFQEHGRGDRAGFHAIYVDLSTQKQRTVSFWWDKDRFLPASSKKHEWVGYKRGSRTGRRDFNLNETHSTWLDDPGANYQHPAKNNITLSDIYVLPNLKKFKIKNNNEFTYSSFIEGRDLIKIIGGKSKVFLLGRHQAGKTTLAKVLFTDYYNKNLTPVIIDGSVIRTSHVNSSKLEGLVEKKFQQQYSNPDLPSFNQLDKDKSVIIIDDFDHAKLNSYGRAKFLEVLCQRFDNIIIFGDDVLKIEELASENEVSEIFNDFEQYEIIQFGHLLRNKLISQWYSLGSEYDGDPEALERRTFQTEQIVNTMLGKSYLPSYPVFVLTLIQSQETNTRSSSRAGTYGSLYEILITQSLATGATVGNLDLKLTYLSELAFWMYQQKKIRITDSEWEKFHHEYCSKYKVYPSRDELKKELSAKGLFDLRDECHGFRYSASFYYFIARYLRDNLSKSEIKVFVRGLLKTLNKEENASIWLFLTHLSKDPFLINEILAHSRKIYNELDLANFESDISFLDKFSASIEQVVLDDKKFCDLKEDRLRLLDKNHTSPVTHEIDMEDSEEETNEALKMISKMNLALRTLEVLGQLIKNFPGSLVGTEKYQLVEECYGLGLRTVTMLFEVYQRDIEGFADLVFDRILDQHPDISNREDLKKKVHQLLYWLIESSSLGMVKRISQAVGHSQLGETYKEILDKSDTNAYALIDISIRLDNLGFPESDLANLSKRFKNNPFCNRILKQLAVQHFYLFPTKEETRQKVCNTLGIELKSIRQIEQQSKNLQKVVPSKPRKKTKKKK